MTGTQIIVKGKVQGVCFRYYTSREGKKLNLNGSVRNLINGNVEIIVQGDPTAIEELKTWCWHGSPSSVVTSVICKTIELQSPLPPFQIAYS